jgi:hypothetical protein
MLALYIILFNYCAACSAEVENKLVDQVTREKYNFETKNSCYHCLVNISSSEKLEKMIANLEEQQQSEERLKNLKLSFNYMSIYNVIIVYIVFGGPKLIPLVTFFGSILICVSIFIKHIHMIYFEHPVAGTSFLIMIKSLCVLLVDMIRIEQQRKQKPHQT